MSTVEVVAAFREYRASLVRVLAGRFGHEEAEDAVSFAFQQLHIHRHRLSADGNLVAWLHTTAVHHALSMRSRGSYRLLTNSKELAGLPEGLHPAAVDGNPDREAEWREAAEVLARLPWQQRNALLCRMVGLSYREAAVACGNRSYTWINRHITEGKAAMREAMAA